MTEAAERPSGKRRDYSINGSRETISHMGENEIVFLTSCHIKINSILIKT